MKVVGAIVLFGLAKSLSSNTKYSDADLQSSGAHVSAYQVAQNHFPLEPFQGPKPAFNPTYHIENAHNADNDSTISSTITTFDKRIKQYLYIPGNAKHKDEEIVLLWTSPGDLFVTYNQGSDWQRIDYITDVMNVYKSKTDDNQVYVYTSDSLAHNNVWISWDYCRTFELVKLPAVPNSLHAILSDLISFHPDYPEWMIFTGSENCDNLLNCPQNSYYSKDKGKTWHVMYRDSLYCYWVHGLSASTHKDMTYCFQSCTPLTCKSINYKEKVVWSTDYFKTPEKRLNGIHEIFDLVFDKNFVVAAALDEFHSLALFISSDGINFEMAKYPPNLKGDTRNGISIIATDDKTVMLYENEYSESGDEFGVLLRSGGFGTNFVKILDNVNRASGKFSHYVDIDRVQSVEGVVLANVVENADDVRKGVDKQVATYITHSNGAKWTRLPAPAGSCERGSRDCYLNLHGYSERLDPRNQPSSPTAVGLIMGRGNVGAELMDLRSSQTFMSRDAGVTWYQVSDRPMFWEFGDSGSFIVLIDSMEPTNKISYSVDEGKTWSVFTFWDIPITVINLATIPSDTSSKFIIFGVPPLKNGDINVAVQLDFSKLANKICHDSDFEMWTPKYDDSNSMCLLGHITEYKRRKIDSHCIVGKSFEDPNKMPTTSRIVKNCQCTREDYECDYGYSLDPQSNTCKLIEGFQKPDQKSQCANGAIAWHEITGYRKYPASTCELGMTMDSPELHACPGKEKEFKQRYPKGGSPSGSNGNLPSPSKGKSFLRRFIDFILWYFMIILVLLGMVFGLYLLYIRFKDEGLAGLGELNLPTLGFLDSSEISIESSLRATGNITKKIASALVTGFEFIQSYTPLFGFRRPQDHLGFYSRMDDDERYRILESDRYEDDFSGDDPIFDYHEPDEIPSNNRPEEYSQRYSTSNDAQFAPFADNPSESN